MDVAGDQLSIQVADNGEGMTLQEQAHAFDLFYSGSKPYNLSKGLGLALSQEFIQLHQGEIFVASDKGKGTTFTVKLPLGFTHLSPEEMDGATPAKNARRQLIPVDITHTNEASLLPPVGNDRAATIVVIEDNLELCTFLSDRLGKEFRITGAKTGELGWNLVVELVPDLVLSDIMLPDLDGLQLTQRIKADLRTSHIPVILLTAKEQLEHKVEGLQAGADAYITKPFHLAYLLESIRTTLANREKWQRRFASNFLAQSTKQPDRKFLNELTATIEANLTTPEFGVEKLSRAMGVSRGHLYRKVQTLLQLNVTDYINSVRLKKAKDLLLETDKNISEVAYETGFSSPAYFTTFFKAHTSKTPSEFRKQSA